MRPQTARETRPQRRRSKRLWHRDNTVRGTEFARRRSIQLRIHRSKSCPDRALAVERNPHHSHASANEISKNTTATPMKITMKKFGCGFIQSPIKFARKE